MPLKISLARTGPRDVTGTVEHRSYIARAMRPRSQFSHGAQVLSFRWRQAIEAHHEEALVQCGERGRGRGLYILCGYRRALGNIPCMLAPLLKEVGIALGFSDYHVERLLPELDAQIRGGLGDRDGRSLGRERPHLWKVEQPFGIGLCAPVRPRSCGSPAPDATGSCRWAVRCSATMSAARSSSGTYWSSSTNIAKPVPALTHASPMDSRSACRSSSRSPLSASPGSGSKSSPTSMSRYFTLRAPAKPARPRSARRANSRPRDFRAQPDHRQPQSRGQYRGQGAGLGSFHLCHQNAPRAGVVAHLQQKDGLAHAPKADEQDTLRRATGAHSFQRYAHPCQQLFAPRQFRWRHARAGRIGILDRIHLGLCYTRISEFSMDR